MEPKNKVSIFLDDSPTPLAELKTPVHLEIDTLQLTDGAHTLKIISHDPSGNAGIRILPFEVRNGPAIEIEGLKAHAVVDGIIPLMINSYGKGDGHAFHISGSESPKSIPVWVWITVISFIAWALYYLVRYLTLP